MAKIINEGTPEVSISGRIGDIVIVQGKNGPFIRKRPKKQHKPKETEQVLKVRNRFAIAAGFIKNATSIIKLGSWPKPTYPVNQAMSEVLKHAIVEDGGEYFIDYSKVLLSKGTSEAPNNISIDCLPCGKINLNYAPIKSGDIMKELIVAIYNPLAGLWDMVKAPWSGKGRFGFRPAAFDILEIYIFLRHADGSNASESRYMGSLSYPGSR